MQIIKTPLSGVIEIIPQIFQDERGYACELYNKEALEKEGLSISCVHTTLSFSKKGVLKGMHFQKNPHSQGKLIRVLKGKILDVVLDLRSDSITYKKWYSTLLDDQQKKMIWIPEGFAHGFLTIEEGSLVEIQSNTPYKTEAQLGIIWNDAEVKIDWQFSVWNISKPILSKKDLFLPSLKDLGKPF